jgi:hypothetical protein
MKLILEIEFGNDAMRTYADVIHALRNVANVTMAEQSFDNPQVGDMCRIPDVNGNSVGKWEVIGDPSPDSIGPRCSACNELLVDKFHTGVFFHVGETCPAHTR